MFVKGSEEYRLMCDRMNLVSRSQSLRKELKKYPDEKEVLQSQIDSIELQIEAIDKRQKEMELELYRSIHEKNK